VISMGVTVAKHPTRTTTRQRQDRQKRSDHCNNGRCGGCPQATIVARTPRV
jgi:hypothetical protein